MLRTLFLAVGAALLVASAGAAARCPWQFDSKVPERWRLNADRTGIEWPVALDARLPHADHVEMSGHRVSVILGYSVGADGVLRTDPCVIWPSYRLQYRATSNQLCRVFSPDMSPALSVGGQRLVERPERISFDGVWTSESRTDTALRLVRRIFPSTDDAATYELLEARNAGDVPVTVEAGGGYAETVKDGVKGTYLVTAKIAPEGSRTLAPGETACWSVRLGVRFPFDEEKAFDGVAELERRRARIVELADQVVLETGVPELDVMFRLCKLLVGESIFHTDAGVLHNPRCGKFYGAIWPEDEIEYVGPWFALTGDLEEEMSVRNACLMFMARMKPSFEKLPGAINAEGAGQWDPFERGDAAMFASGASGFVLFSGRRDWAKRLLPGIDWSLEFCRRKLNAEGVVDSQCDELEMRYTAGKANLCTSALYYEALTRTALIARDLGQADKAADYAARAARLAEAIERHFGANKLGFETYRHYEGCPTLRSWASVALTVGLRGRERGTFDALFSPTMWNGAEMLSCEGNPNVWDRSCLYAFRGFAQAGMGDEVLPKLIAYARNRLLGEHVPYPVEQYFARDGAHSAAEGALFCRIFTEGFFGLRPTGIGTYAVTGRRPKGLAKMRLRNVRGFDSHFDLEL